MVSTYFKLAWRSLARNPLYTLVNIGGLAAGITAHSWLDNFAYRIPIGWWVFLAAGLAASAIALLSIGLQVLKAAASNSARVLRSE